MAYAHETDYNTLSLEDYAERKLFMLEKEFCMTLSKADKEYMNSLPTKDAMDAFCRRLFSERL